MSCDGQRGRVSGVSRLKRHNCGTVMGHGAEASRAGMVR